MLAPTYCTRENEYLANLEVDKGSLVRTHDVTSIIRSFPPYSINKYRINDRVKFLILYTVDPGYNKQKASLSLYLVSV